MPFFSKTLALAEATLTAVDRLQAISGPEGHTGDDASFSSNLCLAFTFHQCSYGKACLHIRWAVHL